MKTAFYLKPKDHLDLAEKILKLILDNDLRKKMGITSLEKSKKYTIHKSIDLLEEVYYKALENK